MKLYLQGTPPRQVEIVHSALATVLTPPTSLQLAIPQNFNVFGFGFVTADKEVVILDVVPGSSAPVLVTINWESEN